MSALHQRVEEIMRARSYSRMNITDVDFSEYEQAKPSSHDLIDPLDLVASVIERQKAGGVMSGCSLPWPKTHNIIRLRPGEVSVWAGINGHGKSLLTGQVALSLVEQGHKVMIASMEMKPSVSFERQAFQAIGNQKPTESAVHEVASWLSGNLWYYTPQGIIDKRRLIAACRYSAKELKCSHIFVDSLMQVTEAPDDYAGQKRFIQELCALGRETGAHIHLVAHARKDGKETDIPDKFSISGTADISNAVDNVFIVFKVKEEAKQKNQIDHDALLVCCKQRHGTGWEGKILLWYHQQSTQFIESKAGHKHDYLPSQKARRYA